MTWWSCLCVPAGDERVLGSREWCLCTDTDLFAAAGVSFSDLMPLGSQGVEDSLLSMRLGGGCCEVCRASWLWGVDTEQSGVGGGGDGCYQYAEQ